MAKLRALMTDWFTFSHEAGQQYRVLALVRGFIKAFAWLSLAFGLIGSLMIVIFGAGEEGTRLSSILVLFISLIYFSFLYMIAEGVKIAVNIENNTRIAARLLGARDNG